MARLSIDTRYLLSVDPGLSTGVAFLSYTDDTSPVLEGAWQFPGGVVGLLAWMRVHTYQYIEGAECFVINPPFHPDSGPDLGDYASEWTDEVTIIAEKFTARNTRGFSYTTASLEPLRGEGALIALGLMPDYTPKEKRWVDPKYQYLVGGKDLPDKKKRQHKFLKDSGFYRTGKDLGAPDADDFRSSASHGLAYLLRGGHTPTLNLVRDWIDINES